MNDIIFTIVFLAFAFIIGKYKLIPYFAARKILKESKKKSQESGNATDAHVMPQQIPITLPYGGYPVALGQQPEAPKKREIGFDYGVIEYASDGGIDGSYIFDTRKVREMINRLNQSGVCPDKLDIVNLGDGLAVAYVTYHV